MSWQVGDVIRFEDERYRYTVQAISADGRYLACTRPFPLRQTVLYTVVDLQRKIRGVDNSIGNSLGYETREACERAIGYFERGEFTFSGRRRPIELRIKRANRQAGQAIREALKG